MHRSGRRCALEAHFKVVSDCSNGTPSLTPLRPVPGILVGKSPLFQGFPTRSD